MKQIVPCLVFILVVTLVFPMPARSQVFLLGLVRILNTVYDTIKNLGNTLVAITDLTQWFKDLFQITLFPKQAIEAARSFVASMSERFRGLVNAVLRFSVASATLSTTRPLESLIRSGTLNFNQLSQHYRNVYGVVPPPEDASPLDRNLIDVDDSLALDSLKSLGVSDSTIGVGLDAAGRIEDSLKDPLSAPGAAPFMSASGIIATIHTQVMMQKMIATQIRQEAGILAHRNTLLKRNILLASEMRGNISNILRHK